MYNIKRDDSILIRNSIRKEVWEMGTYVIIGAVGGFRNHEGSLSRVCLRKDTKLEQGSRPGHYKILNGPYAGDAFYVDEADASKIREV